jgi:hypothetical protein
MTEAAAPETTARAKEDPYETRTITHDGHDYTFRFYKGFASRVVFNAPDGTQIPVYQQSGTFDCQDTGGPLENSTLTVTGGPLALDVEVEILDSPIRPPEYRGPVADVQIGFKKRGTPVPPNPHVKPLRGADQISRINVKNRGNGGGGGVQALQSDPGGSLDLENAAQTCPPTC